MGLLIFGVDVWVSIVVKVVFKVVKYFFKKVVKKGKKVGGSEYIKNKWFSIKGKY